jgi:hypothetical protein
MKMERRQWRWLAWAGMPTPTIMMTMTMTTTVMAGRSVRKEKLIPSMVVRASRG